MPYEITTTVIATFGAIVVALITSVLAPILLSIRKHAKRAADQTGNSHSENLRDDVDLVIVGLHQLNSALGVENTLVRERAHKIRHRRDTL